MSARPESDAPSAQLNPDKFTVMHFCFVGCMQVNTTLEIFTTPANSSGTGMTECLIACRQYRPANPEIPHCNIWNWCNGTANCTYALNATRNTIPTRTCLLGYSAAAGINLPVAPVNLANAGYWSGQCYQSRAGTSYTSLQQLHD